MKSKALLSVVVTLALLLVWMPAASAKAKWAYGNGQTDLSVDVAPGTTGAVCGTSISGFAGEGTSVDPRTSPPAPSTSGIKVELFVAPASQGLGGATVVAGGLLLPDGSLIPPLQTVTTAPPTALDPPEVYYDFSNNPIWEYSEAPFAFSLPGGLPANANVVVHRVGRSAYYNTVAVDCTTTSLSSNKNPSAQTDTINFTATVKSETGGTVSHGDVQFMVDGVVAAANVSVDANGQALFNANWLTPGSHVVKANYLGAQSYPDYSFTTSSGSLTQKVSSGTSDTTPPTLAPSLADGSSFAVGQPAPTVNPGAQDADSGIASSSCGAVDTTAVGARSVTCNATDNAGNTATVTRNYTVTHAFLGYTYPTSRSWLGRGWTVPVRFALGNFQGSTRVTNAIVRITVTPSSQPSPAAPTNSACACAATAFGYLCLLTLPRTPGSYQIRAWQNIGTTANPHYVVVQNAAAVAGGSNANPLNVTIR